MQVHLRWELKAEKEVFGDAGCIAAYVTEPQKDGSIN